MAWKRTHNIEKSEANQFPILPKYNYATGAGWKSRKGSTIGNRPSGAGQSGDNHAFALRRKRRG